MRKVVLLRSNPVNPDPPVEKTADFLLELGCSVFILAWDRSSNDKTKHYSLNLKHGKAEVYCACLKGQFSGGIRKNLISLVRYQIFLYDWLMSNSDKYDVIQAYDLDTGYVASKVAQSLNKKFIYAILDYYVASHGLQGSFLGSIVKDMEDKVIGRSNATVICTEKRKEQIKDAKPQKLYVIHNTPMPISVQMDETKICKSSSDKLKIVYVGVFGNQRLLVELTEVVSSRDDCELHIGGFGAGMESYFEKMAIKYDNIYYYGRLKYQDTLNLESSCDVMTAIYNPMVPNHKFAAPNKFYESLMLGKPIIMVRDTGFDEIIEKENIGELIDYNSESLNLAISNLISKKEKWQEMRENAKRLYDSQFSWNIMKERLMDMYANL